jgi:hypothetical protein
MRLARLAQSVPLLVLGVSLAMCAHGVDENTSLLGEPSGPGGAAGSGGTAGVGGDGTAGSAGTGPDVDANPAGPGGSNGSAGFGGSAGTSAGGQPIADAQPDSAGGAGGMGGNAGSGAGFDAREATVDARPEAGVDAPPEVGCTNPAQCALKAALVHRYSFNGTGTAVIDSVGNADGTVVGTTLSGNGTLIFPGGTADDYVNLPNGIIRSLTDATIEIWLAWGGGAAWQRLFDFGNSTGAEGTQGMASTSLYVTPEGGGPTVMFAGFKRSDQTGPAETRALGTQGLAAGPLTQITVVVDDANNMISLYRNGALQGSAAFNDSLSILNDVNNWIGRSQYSADPHLWATIHEFRIYNIALSAAQLQLSFTGGTDPTFLN